MIGFDRPLRPEWIHELMTIAEPGQKLQLLNKPFEEIAIELTGKEGIRKARTVLFRAYLRGKKYNLAADRLLLKSIAQKHTLDFMVPIYLFVLIGKTDILRTINDMMFRLYDFGNEINSTHLQNKLVELKGERDVVLRSVRSYMQTLINFRVAKKDKKKLSIPQAVKLSKEQASLILQLYALEILQSPQISTKQLPKSLFGLFELPDLKNIVKQNNGKLWNYQERLHDKILIVKEMKE